MAWVRIDDQAPRNQKMLQAGPAACWLWVCGIAHCQSQLTDGFISHKILPMIGVLGTTRVRKLADVLVSAGLFDPCEGGYRVHDYHVFNDTRAEALAKKQADHEQRRQAGVASGHARRDKRTLNEPVSVSLNETSPASLNEPVGVSLNPIPSHPIPSQKAEKAEKAAAIDARSKRPIYTSDRFAVFEWQLDELGRILGPHLDAFDLHAFFDDLSQRSRRDGLVIPRADVWPWLQRQVLEEAKRRRLPIVGTSRSVAEDTREVARLLGIDPEKAGIPS